MQEYFIYNPWVLKWIGSLKGELTISYASEGLAEILDLENLEPMVAAARNVIEQIPSVLTIDQLIPKLAESILADPFFSDPSDALEYVSEIGIAFWPGKYNTDSLFRQTIEGRIDDHDLPEKQPVSLIKIFHREIARQNGIATPSGSFMSIIIDDQATHIPLDNSNIVVSVDGELCVDTSEGRSRTGINVTNEPIPDGENIVIATSIKGAMNTTSLKGATLIVSHGELTIRSERSSRTLPIRVKDERNKPSMFLGGLRRVVVRVIGR